MSITFTAKQIPAVAGGSWESIDRYLTIPNGDWRQLRTSLIRTVCRRQGADGLPITQPDMEALIQLYDREDPPASFVAAWNLVRLERL